MSVAALHVWAIFEGPDAYRFLGAGEDMARLVEQGSWLPGLLTLWITGVFAVFGLYALAGARLIKPLPYTHEVLWGITAIYSLRGAVLMFYLLTPGPWRAMGLLSSAASLGIGLLHLVGMLRLRVMTSYRH